MPANGVAEMVREHYGETLSHCADIQTSNACSLNASNVPAHVKTTLSMISPEITSKFYGCGVLSPDMCEGLQVLDLGSGCGRDSFVLSKLVGEEGRVTGIDMTQELIELSTQWIPYHMEKFGYKTENVRFVRGYLEKMGEVGIQDRTYDLAISNGVINLTADKNAVLKEASRVLKTGGELYLTDTFTDTQLSEEAKANKLLWSECIAGAHYWPEFVQLCKANRFSTPRLIESETMKIECADMKKATGDARFVSATYRMFKLPQILDYPADVTYEGGIPYSDQSFKLDSKTEFKKGETVEASPELTTILASSRFFKVFTLETIGDDDIQDDEENDLLRANPFSEEAKKN